MKVNDEALDSILLYKRIFSRDPDKGKDRVAAFFGKSECAAMSRLTGMAGEKSEKKSRYLCTQS